MSLIVNVKMRIRLSISNWKEVSERKISYWKGKLVYEKKTCNFSSKFNYKNYDWLTHITYVELESYLYVN